jgi:DNA-binding transcriptional LysR family regulator
MNQFLGTIPFDLYELALFHLVVKHASFTQAAAAAGLTQSAITRQIKGIENSLGIQLLERTTRRVKTTAAGDYLFHEAGRLLGDVDQSLQHLAQTFAGAPKEIRVAVSRTVSLAYLPGFFHANLKHRPNVAYRVTSQPSGDIIGGLEQNSHDLGVLCPPRRIPKSLRVTHRFQDSFTLVANEARAVEYSQLTKSKERLNWLGKQDWLLIEAGSDTGSHLQGWMRKQGLQIQPTMQLDNFDLIINLVSLGLGISFVPIRALALYNRRRNLVRLKFPARFTRQLVVVVRKHREPRVHIDEFIRHVLF